MDEDADEDEDDDKDDGEDESNTEEEKQANTFVSSKPGTKRKSSTKIVKNKKKKN